MDRRAQIFGEAYRGLSVEEAFTRIYSDGTWGVGSGSGSCPEHAQPWVAFLRKFLREERVRSVVDLGCGDWQFSPLVYDDQPSVEYTGYDCVASVVSSNVERHPGYRFEHLEFSECAAKLRDAEVYILKDVLQHWRSERISAFLGQLLEAKAGRGLRFVLLCNDSAPPESGYRGADVGDGGWRPLGAELPPLAAFAPEVLLRFEVPGAIKEVCALRPPVALPGAAEVGTCAFCGLEGAPARCSRCRRAYFCGPECQSRHWPRHKLECR